MKNSTVPRTPVRSILATVLLTALGFLALGLQSVWAQNSTGSNLGGAFAARTSSSGTSLLAPFYWIPTAGAGFSVSSGTTAAPGAPSPNFSYFHSLSTMTVGNGYGCALTGDTDVGDGSTVKYLVEVAFPSSNVGTDIVVGLASANCAISGVTHGTAAACTALQSSFAASPNWSSVCLLTLNAGATHPDIQFKFVSGTGTLRFYATVLRFTRQAIPCQQAGVCGIQGPVSTNQATVTVTGVTNAGDQAVFVYQKNSANTETLIGQLIGPAGGGTDTIVVGANTVPVTWDSTSLGAQLIATQVTPAGQEGCHLYPGYLVGGGPNPRIRVSINCRTSPNNLNAGPVGANSDSTGTPGLFFMPGPANSTQSPQSSGMVVNPGTNWQTIVIDPRTVAKGWIWAGTRSGSALSAADNVGTWAGWESLILNMDDVTDNGPFDIYLDNFYSGNDPLTAPANQPLGWGCETNAVDDTQLFFHPAYTGFPAPGEFEGPESALVSNLQAAGGTNANRVRFQFSGLSVGNWVRLLAEGGYFTFPQIRMDAPFQFDMLLLPKGATQGYAVGNAPPIADQSGCSGGSFTTAVNVTAPGDPNNYGQLLPRTYTYQWKKNGTAISGATSSSYTTNPISAGSSGTYSVVVTDQSGNSLTRSMILTVPTIVQIDTQPTDQGPVTTGSPATLSVSASIPASCPCANSPALTYQWSHNGSPVAGATDSAYNIASVSFADAGSYNVVVSNTCAGQTVTSTTAKLYVSDGAAHVDGCGTGILGLYWTNHLSTSPFSGDPAWTNADSIISFDWGAGSFNASLFPDATNYFTVRWAGTIQAPFDGQPYTFYTRTDDGVRLWVNGQLLIDKWILQAPTKYSATITLSTNAPVDFVMEYYENAGGAVAEVQWESWTVVSNTIPASQFCPADANTGIPPVTALTSPANNSSGTPCGPVTLSANVTPFSATVNKVEFYNNGTTLLATVAAPGPYTASWTPPALGVYNITARTYYNTTHTLNTPSNKLTVSAPVLSPVTIVTPIANGATLLSYTGGSGSQFVLLGSANASAPLNTWARLATNNCPTPGSFSVPTVGVGPQTYYSIKSE
jgi:hypothetical protein